MNHLTTTATVLILATVVTTAAVVRAKDDAADPAPAKPPATAPQPFAIVELFTSEGCSSCPPADAILSNLVKDARARHQRIFPLSFHVDYWNNLGWRDPFSDAAYSDRQRAYADAMRLDSTYTPQMIVNGQVQFVGSNGRLARNEIDTALKRPATVAIQLAAKLNDQHDALRLDYTLTGGPTRNCTLNLALVQRNLTTKVARGENANRTLHHDNVVRAFRAIPLKEFQGQADLPIPADVNLNETSVVAYAQDPAFKVLGAALFDMPATKPPARH